MAWDASGVPQSRRVWYIVGEQFAPIEINELRESLVLLDGPIDGFIRKTLVALLVNLLSNPSLGFILLVRGQSGGSCRLLLLGKTKVILESSKSGASFSPA